MRTVKTEKQTAIYLNSPEDSKRYKKIAIIFAVIFGIFDIIQVINEEMNKIILLVEVVSISFIVLMYYMSKKGSKTPYILMKDGVLKHLGNNKSINFSDIVKLEIPRLGSSLVVSHYVREEIEKTILFFDTDMVQLQLVAERIKEYALENGFRKIRYENCLMEKK